MSFLFYINKLQKLQKSWALFILRTVFYTNAIFNKKIQTQDIHCYCDKDINGWINILKNKTQQKVVDCSYMDCSFQSIQRQIFKNKRLPKFLFIVFPEITRVEVYDELRSTYVCVFLPQIRKKNIHFLENRILEKNTSIKYSDFLYLFKHETLINDCIHRLKQIQHFCKKHNIKLYFILPEFFLAKIDKTVLEKILDCNVNFYKESNVDYNQLAGLFNIKL